jgi:hypothetical protein
MGCNQVFGLEPTVFVPMDRDGDATADAEDNCPDLPNESQADEDGDSIGDACDNCPLVENTQQNDVGDLDGIGDACDAHPTSVGDCLVLLDSLADAMAFDLHWSATNIRIEPGFVTLTPPGMTPASMIARGSDGNVLAGVFDVHVLGDAQFDRGGIAAVSGADSLDRGYGCALGIDMTLNALAFARDGTGNDVETTFDLELEPIGTGFLLRLTIDDPPTGFPTITCRVDYSLAIGLARVTSRVELMAAGTGVGAAEHEFRVDAVALYNHQPGVACPAPIRR